MCYCDCMAGLGEACSQCCSFFPLTLDTITHMYSNHALSCTSQAAPGHHLNSFKSVPFATIPDRPLCKKGRHTLLHHPAPLNSSHLQMCHIGQLYTQSSDAISSSLDVALGATEGDHKGCIKSCKRSLNSPYVQADNICVFVRMLSN